MLSEFVSPVDWLEKKIQNILEYAKSDPTIIEAMKVFGMSWDEYELRLRAYLGPTFYFYNSSNTTDVPILEE